MPFALLGLPVVANWQIAELRERVRPKLAHKVDRTFVHCRRAISQLLWDSELAEVVEFVLGRCYLYKEIRNREELMRTSNYIVARLQGGGPV